VKDGEIQKDRQELAIVKNGKPAAVIVIGRDASPKASKAAEELRDYVVKMTGISLKITKNPDEAGEENRILVGNIATKLFPRLRLKRGIYPVKEKFIMKVDGRNLLLVGNDSGTYQGTLSAVYSFLERKGCRWFAPGDLWEVIPKVKNLSAKRSLNVEETPDFIQRAGVWYHFGKKMHSPKASAKLKAWKLRNKGGGVRFSGGHAMGRYISKKEYFKEHPEYFAMVNGTRMPTQICYTNNEVVRIVVAKIRRFFNEHPQKVSVSLSENDAQGFCACPACLKIAGDGVDGISRMQLHFLNKVARELKKSHPGKFILFMAYRGGETAEVPVGMKAEDNLFLSLTSYAVFIGHKYCYMHPMSDPNCPVAKRSRSLTEGWGKVAKRARWSEHINDYATEIGRPYVQCSKKNIPFLKRNNFVGYLEESSEHSWLSMGPHNYVVMKLLWNTSENPDHLIDEYFNLLYGEAAPYVKKYYAVLTKALSKNPHAGHTAKILPAIFAPVLNECQRLLNEAALAAETAKKKRRVAKLKDYFKLLRGYCRLLPSIRKWQMSGKRKEKEEASQALKDFERVAESIKNDGIVAYPILKKFDIGPFAKIINGTSKIDKIGDFTYSDGYNWGGMARIDPIVLKGFHFSRYGLSLKPGGQGEIVYRFDAPRNGCFSTARLHLQAKSPKDVENKLFISTDNGATMVLLKGAGGRNNGLFSLDKYVAGKTSFIIKFTSKYKNGNASKLILDHFRLTGRVVKKKE
jgi:hypothetical protein